MYNKNKTDVASGNKIVEQNIKKKRHKSRSQPLGLLGVSTKQERINLGIRV